MTDRRDRSDGRPTGEEMLARLAGSSGPTDGAGCGSTSAWRPASARRTGCSRRRHRRARARDGRRRRLRRVPRPAAHRSRCSTGWRSCPASGSTYRGVVVEEMDTDAVIARKPTVAIIDELAHTNAPGFAAREALAGRRAHPRRRHPRHLDLQRPAPRVRRRRRRDDHRRAGPRAAARTRSSPRPTRSSSST